jgi:hypothetical protein
MLQRLKSAQTAEELARQAEKLKQLLSGFQF